MARAKVTFDVVREIGLALPDVEESTAYGAFALKVSGDLLACVATNKSAEPGSLVVRMDFEQRAGLIAEAPETYYVTDHYVNHPAMLVRLSQIRVDQMRDLLNSAWKFVTSKKKRTASRSAAPVGEPAQGQRGGRKPEASKKKTTVKERRQRP
jgi:hypothetical protein